KPQVAIRTGYDTVRESPGQSSEFRYGTGDSYATDLIGRSLAEPHGAVGSDGDRKRSGSRGRRCEFSEDLGRRGARQEESQSNQRKRATGPSAINHVLFDLSYTVTYSTGPRVRMEFRIRRPGMSREIQDNNGTCVA